jgi:hypothetical protein
MSRKLDAPIKDRAQRDKLSRRVIEDDPCPTEAAKMQMYGLLMLFRPNKKNTWLASPPAC